MASKINNYVDPLNSSQSPMLQPSELDALKDYREEGIKPPASGEVPRAGAEKESTTYSKKDFKKIDLSWEHLNIQAIVRRRLSRMDRNILSKKQRQSSIIFQDLLRTEDSLQLWVLQV